MRLTLRYPSALNLSRVLPVAGFFVLAILSFVAFRMPAAAGIGVGALVILALGLRFPLVTLYVYAGSTFLSYVPLGGLVGITSATGAIFLISAGVEGLLGNTSHAMQSFVQKSHISRWVLLFWMACCVSALANPREFLSNPRGLATYAGLLITVPAIAFLLQTGQSIVRISQILVFGTIAAATLTCYQSLSGSYNTFEFFNSGPPAERAYGFTDPNYTSATLDTIFPLLFALLLTASRPVVKALLTVSLFVTLVAVGMTASRGGFLGLVLAVVMCMFLVSPVRWNRSNIAKRFGVGLLLLGIFGVAMVVSPENLWERVSTLGDDEKVGNESRIRVWEDYIKDIREKPWLGYGPGYVTPDTEDERTIIQHSTPLEFLTEIGGVGFAIYLGLSVWVIYKLWQARGGFLASGNAQMAAISGALIAGLFAFHLTSLFLNRGNDKQLWVLFGVAASVVSLAHRQHRVPTYVDDPRILGLSEVVT